MSIAIIRNIDKQGRIIIPAEIRRTMQLREGEPLEFIADKEGLFLRKYDILDSKQIQRHLNILFKTVRCNVAAASETHIIASKGIHIPAKAEITLELARYIHNRKQVIFNEPIPATINTGICVDTIIPFASSLAILLFNKTKSTVTDNERMAAQLIAALLTKEEQIQLN